MIYPIKRQRLSVGDTYWGVMETLGSTEIYIQVERAYLQYVRCSNNYIRQLIDIFTENQRSTDLASPDIQTINNSDEYAKAIDDSINAQKKIATSALDSAGEQLKACNGTMNSASEWASNAARLAVGWISFLSGGVS